jgi:2-amino-4-hydroxy-6-hydroxymethyldihydropteridine diphosphokinase
MTRFWPFRLPRPLRRSRTAFLGLGSNEGDRLELIREAIGDLDRHDEVTVEAVSTVYETEPVVPDDAPAELADQPDYLNCAVCVTTTLGARALLELAHEVEAAHGRQREREVRHGPRTLDIDLLLYDDATIDEPGLTVPHPELADRAFALVPLAEIMPPASVLPDGTRLAVRLAELAPIEGVEFHVRLTEGPGAESDPLSRRPAGPPGGPPRLGERQGGPGLGAARRRHRESER